MVGFSIHVVLLATSLVCIACLFGSREASRGGGHGGHDLNLAAPLSLYSPVVVDLAPYSLLAMNLTTSSSAVTDPTSSLMVAADQASSAVVADLGPSSSIRWQ